MKINLPELSHYIIGGVILAISFPMIMAMVSSIYLAVAAWILEYIVVDQILHLVIKGEKISIVR